MKLLGITIILASITFFSCETVRYGHKYENGNLPDTPVNLEDFNTEYDDYNSTAPTSGELIPFCFSTNRNSNGANFDIIYQPMNVKWDKSTGDLTVKNEYDNWGIYEEEFDILHDALENISTSGNEFGPNLILPYHGDFEDAQLILLYATDINGELNINFISKQFESDFTDSQPIVYLNSQNNDAYPTFNTNYTKIYFCSDRDDDIYNIFFADIEYSNHTLLPVLSDTSNHQITKELILSSSFDDKCPYIFENFLVFTSNRPGGYGGFDLYYSRFENEEWTEPTNFGPEINSEYDEYRPILFNEGVDFLKHMMVFSSNRPGGKGGFDLYFVGVPKV